MATMLGHESPQKKIETPYRNETLPPAPKSPMAKGCSKLGLGGVGKNTKVVGFIGTFLLQ